MMVMVVYLVMFVFMRTLQVHGRKLAKILMEKQVVIIVAGQYPYLQMEIL